MCFGSSPVRRNTFNDKAAIRPEKDIKTTSPATAKDARPSIQQMPARARAAQLAGSH